MGLQNVQLCSQQPMYRWGLLRLRETISTKTAREIFTPTIFIFLRWTSERQEPLLMESKALTSQSCARLLRSNSYYGCHRAYSQERVYNIGLQPQRLTSRFWPTLCQLINLVSVPHFFPTNRDIFISLDFKLLTRWLRSAARNFLMLKNIIYCYLVFILFYCELPGKYLY